MTQLGSSGPRSVGSPTIVEPLLNPPLARLKPLLRKLAIQLVGAAVLGVLAGVVWNMVVDLPGYVLSDEGVASMTERDLTGFFSTDYWFTVIGLVVGLILGVWSWLSFEHRRWYVVPLALVSASMAALLCWWVGEAMGPNDFNERLSRAHPGEVVPIDFHLEAYSALAAWPLAAVIPLMLASAFLPEPDDRALRRLGRRRHTPGMALPGASRVSGVSAGAGVSEGAGVSAGSRTPWHRARR